MSRETYGALIGALTFISLLLPVQLFALVIALLALAMGRELSKALGVEGLYPACFFSPLLYTVHPALGGVYTALMSLAYGYRSWDLEAFFRAFFILFYTGFFTSFLILLRDESFYLTITFLLSVWANDVFAYYIGRRFGKTPLLPKLSPKKTLEGFLGGLGAGALLFTFMSGIHPLRAFIIGLAFLSVGVSGDYFKSFIKRQVGIKDFSSVLGGHGGFVDRFDAVVFSAPVFYWLIFRI